MDKVQRLPQNTFNAWGGVVPFVVNEGPGMFVANEGHEMLELDARRRIYDFVRDHPGTYLRKLARDLGMPLGTLEYHVHHLESSGLLSTRAAGRFKAFFVNDGMDRRDKDVLAWLRQRVPRGIVTALMLEPNLTHAELAQRLRIGASTLTFHAQRLVQAGIVQEARRGRSKEYSVVDRDRVADLLVRHRGSFLDRIVDQFAEVWLGLGPPRETAPVDDAATSPVPQEAPWHRRPAPELVP